MSKDIEDDRTDTSRRIGRRRLLGGASALGAAGWVAGSSGGWLLAPKWANAAGPPIKMGIATDITGAIAPSGNANWQVAQFAVEAINKAGGVAGKPIELYLRTPPPIPRSPSATSAS